jgi:hypothetical protein
MPCKAHRVIENPKPKYIRGARGIRLQLQGKCSECGAVVNRFLKTKGRHLPPLPGPEESPVQAAPKRDKRRSRPSLHVVTYYRGFCQRCRAERRFTGSVVGTRYDGKAVLQGSCLTCQQPQVVLGVREDEEGEDDE